MNRCEEILRRLLRMAADKERPAEMPFGFDTRVLARVREASANASTIVALFARRVMALACAVIVLTTAGFYTISLSESNADPTNEYGIVDRAIQNNLE